MQKSKQTMHDPSLLWKISFAAACLSFMILPVIGRNRSLGRDWRGVKIRPFGAAAVDHPGAFWLLPIGLLNGIMLGRGEWADLGMSIFNFSVTLILILGTIRRLSK